MKYYRIVRKPDLAIVNVEIGDATYVGYSDIKTAERDLVALKGSYPDWEFQIVTYVTLRING